MDIQICDTVYSRCKLSDSVRSFQINGEDLPRSGLVPANLGCDGIVYVGAKGSLHFLIAEQHPEGAPFQGLGFVTPDGQFLDRAEALVWVDRNERPMKSSLNMLGELDALDYREHKFFMSNLD